MASYVGSGGPVKAVLNWPERSPARLFTARMLPTQQGARDYDVSPVAGAF